MEACCQLLLDRFVNSGIAAELVTGQQLAVIHLAEGANCALRTALLVRALVILVVGTV